VKIGIRPIYGRAFKIQSTHDRIPTDIIEGFTLALPRAGFRFGMFGPGQAEANCRVFFSSVVQEIAVLSNGILLFRTENSTYCFAQLPIPIGLSEPVVEGPEPDPNPIVLPRGVGLESPCAKARRKDKGQHYWRTAMGDPTTCANCDQWWDGVYPSTEAPKTES